MVNFNGIKISNQLGLIDPNTDFLPFGLVAVIGSYLDIEFGRIADIKPQRISLRLLWVNLPVSFGIYFQGYQWKNGIDNHSFHVNFYLNTGEDLHLLNDRPLNLFTEGADRLLKQEKVFNLHINSEWIYSDTCSLRMVFVGSEFAFGHEVYAEALVKAILCEVSGEQAELPNPPFDLKVKKLSISFS